MNQMSTIESKAIERVYVCSAQDLVPFSGICVLVGNEQIAIFYFPDESPCVYGVSNWDPIGKANVLSRGIVGDVDGELVVASPLYKQHFSLTTGLCIEQEDTAVDTYKIELDGSDVFLHR